MANATDDRPIRSRAGHLQSRAGAGLMAGQKKSTSQADQVVKGKATGKPKVRQAPLVGRRRADAPKAHLPDELQADIDLVAALGAWGAKRGKLPFDAEVTAAVVIAYLDGRATIVMHPKEGCPSPCMVAERTLRLFEMACAAGNRNVDPDTLFDIVHSAGEVAAARALDRTVVHIDDGIDDDIPF